MLRTRLAVVAGALLLGAVGTPAFAQSCVGNPCTVANTHSVTVPTLLRLALSAAPTTGSTPTATNLTAPDTIAMNAGFQADQGPTANVKANRPWTLSVVGASATWSYAGALTNPNKAASDLKWDTNAGGTFTNNMGATAALATGNGTASTNASIFYRTTYSYTADVPGTYTLVVNFTLTAP
jgi:hypothetical protein